MSSFDLEMMCRVLMKDCEGLLIWKWDDRFGAVLSEFDVTVKDNVRAVLEGVLSVTWDRLSVTRAPAHVRRISDLMGGVLPGQLLFTSDPNQENFVFCAWWPWGNGKTISVRLAPVFQRIDHSERAEKIEWFKDLFLK